MSDLWDVDTLLVFLATLVSARRENPDTRAVLHSLFRLSVVELMNEPQKRALVTIFAPLEAEQLLRELEEEYEAEVAEFISHSRVNR